MILGIGIDLCEVERVACGLENGFLERYFTPEEQAYITGRGKGAAESLAGHFAAKEAAVKALGCGIAFALTDIAVTHDAVGAPALRLAGEAQRRFDAMGAARALLSITHTDTTAAAVVIVEA